ncbi:MAG: hypothetical protein FWH26_03225 [Oscillospiraceae bacterium]|nr:hypothetical protein [Oscillospiraceae bacterium]
MGRKVILLVAVALMLLGILAACSASTTPKGGKFKDAYKYITDSEIYREANDEFGFYEKVSYTIDKLTYTDDTKGIATVTVTAPDMEKIILEATKDIPAKQKGQATTGEFDLNSSPEQFIEYMEAPIKRSEEASKQLRENIKEQLSDNNYEVLTTTFEMEIIKEKWKWKLIPNKDWDNAVNGNLITIWQKYYKMMLEDYK